MNKDNSTIRVIVEVDKATIYQARKDYKEMYSGNVPSVRAAAKAIAQDLIDRYCGAEWIDIEVLKGD